MNVKEKLLTMLEQDARLTPAQLADMAQIDLAEVEEILREFEKNNTILGYKTVMWSLAYDDWDENKQGREDYGTQKILDNIHPGCVILLHATSKDNSNILDYCIKEIKKMGYEFKSLDEFQR